jgi:hypothetical protein
MTMKATDNTPSDPASTVPLALKNLALFQELSTAALNGFAAISRYATEFFIPALISSTYFSEVEKKKALRIPPVENFSDYLNLLAFNLDLLYRGVAGAFVSTNRVLDSEGESFYQALEQYLKTFDPTELLRFTRRQAALAALLAEGYPQAIEAIAPQFGFHFESGAHPKVAETDRFFLYQVAPSDKSVTVQKNVKPLLILPPYVLGANILAFLPGEKKSYAHAFANHGIPTYIRILKDIETTEALQVMTGEDDARDTRYFCEVIRSRHGKAVTLNGYCQGGFSALCNLLSGELDGLVDAFITCVAPMDGTRSRGLADFLQKLPPRFNDLEYGTKTLKSGNAVADGKLMGWVYKLKSIDIESPVAAMNRDYVMFAGQRGESIRISKTAAALNYWLNHERNDLPMEITKMSFASYNTPITPGGILPVKLFGKTLNVKRLAEKRIPWLICYGEGDELVEKETALAPLDYVNAEVTPFPKGHVAIATSWSHPESACPLHARFGENNSRGPVLFQLDLDAPQETKQIKKKRRTG